MNLRSENCRAIAILAAWWLLTSSGPARSQAGDLGSHAGYAIVNAPQVVTDPPPGWTGHKITDHVTRTGNTPATQGLSATYAITFGGFVKACPTAAGVVEGNFESLLVADLVTREAGETRQAHYSKHVVANLQGHVGNDGMLEYVDIDAVYTGELAGVPPEQRHVRERFKPGRAGEPDMEAMIRAVEATNDMTIASVILMSGKYYSDAMTEWTRPGRCVEFLFDPASGTRSLRPDESIQVQATLVTLDGQLPVGEAKLDIRLLQGAGNVSPTSAETGSDGLATISYTADAKPRKGNGFSIATDSRAGSAVGEWRINDGGRYEGTFTQTDTTAMAVTIGSVHQVYTVTGRLVWTPAGEAQPPSSVFGAAGSAFFRPSDGEITVDIKYDGQGLTGVCTYSGRKSFPIAGLPPNALQYLRLEIAPDGRYELSLGMQSNFLAMTVESNCTRGGRETLAVNDAAILLGTQQGTLIDGNVVGQLSVPMRRGPRTTEGSWSFRKSN